MSPALVAVVLGLVEGATEFLPVSSTGHLILAGHWLGFEGDRAKTFEIFIQLGAILAIVWLYRRRLTDLVLASRAPGPERRLLLNLLIAFLPVAVVGVVVHHWITEHLFTPLVVAVALVIGGVIILVIEAMRPATRVRDVGDVPSRTALGIGIAQLLSLIPGTSRSGATILGGYSLGLSRKAATEFSFFLAIPVMVAATLFDLFKNRHALGGADVPMFAIGFAVSFVVALAVVRLFLRFVSHNSFRPFAWYRIVFGGVLLALFLTHRLA